MYWLLKQTFAVFKTIMCDCEFTLNTPTLTREVNIQSSKFQKFKSLNTAQTFAISDQILISIFSNIYAVVTNYYRQNRNENLISYNC